MCTRKLHILNCVLLLTLPSVQAVAALQMHVFEQAVSPISENRNQKQALKIHVFDNSTALQNNAVVPSYKKRLKQSKKPLLAYQRADAYFKTGYRRDDLDWSIAGFGGTPNILSELTWKDIEIATINVGTTLYTRSNWLVNFDLVYGQIFDGKNQDSDYFGNNRTLEFSRSNNGADEGDTLDISVAIGYLWQLPLNQQSSYPSIELRPQGGLSYNSQNLKIVDGFQTIPAFGAFSGLNSSYDATWFGPWLGLDSKISFNQNFKLSMNLEYHYTFYDATANWNLRSDFAHPESFTHEAEGYGLVGNIDAQYRLANNLSLTASIDYQEWQANRNGIDKTFFSNGSSITIGFNGVNWRSFGANLGLIYEF